MTGLSEPAPDDILCQPVWFYWGYCMELPHDSILSYLKKNHVVTLCATAGDDLWCASCFYVADTGAMMLYFLTEPHTGTAP